MPQIGPLEIIVIFVVALVVFGPTKLPEIGRQVGKAMGELRRFQASFRRDLDDVMRVEDDEPTPAPKLPPKELAAGPPGAAQPSPEPGPPVSPQAGPPVSPQAGPPVSPQAGPPAGDTTH